MQRAFLLIYSFFYIIALIFLLPIEYFKRPSRIKKRWLKEKFGLFKKNLTHTTSLSSQPKIWIHAVSVGEVIAISNLIKKLTNKYEIVLSTITDTGQKVATDKFKDYPVRVIYLPFDVNFAIRRTIKFFNVSLLILTETELWPNLIFFSSKKIPVVLVNGRLSEKSFKGYKKIRFFIRHLINKLNLICVQDETYRDRFIKIGAKEEKLHITGNMKFDIEIEKIPFNWESCIPRPVIIAGSTHEPEEDIMLNAFFNLHINGTLIIAPRHPERYKEIETLIKTKITESDKKIFFLKLSELSSDFSSLTMPQPSALIILIDQMGILGALYRIGDIAIIGGSFIPHGGQNPLEPAYWRKPIICGPYMHNFPFIKEFIKEKACIVTDKNNLENTIKKLIESPENKLEIGKRAYNIFSKNAGATEKTINLLRANGYY